MKKDFLKKKMVCFFVFFTVLFLANPQYSFSTTPPILRLDPEVMPHITLEQDYETTQMLTLYNDGGEALTFKLRVESVAVYQQAVESAVQSLIKRSGILDVPITLDDGGSEIGDGETRTVILTESSQISQTKWASGVMSSLNVAVLGAESQTNLLTDIQEKLLGTGRFASVSIINVRTVTPTLSELQAFDAVQVHKNGSYYNNVQLGDVLADYVDAGGGVVAMVFETNTNLSNWLGGRWQREEYFVISRGDSQFGPRAYLGTVHAPGHPIMRGVSTFDGGSGSPRPTTFDITDGAEKIADWSDGHPFVVTNMINGHLRADVAFYPPSSDVGAPYGGGWDSSTDGALLMANALTWVAGQSWLTSDITSGTIAPGEPLDIILTYSAVGLEVGDYTANIVITSNDPLNPEVTVPASLTVTPDVTPPAAVSDLVVTDVTFESVLLTWTVVADNGAVGAPAESYDIRYSTHPPHHHRHKWWDNATQVNGEPVPGKPGLAESFWVTGLSPSTRYYFAMKVLDDMGLISGRSNVVSGTTLAAPVLEVNPASIADTLMEGDSSAHTLILSNTGGDTLVYSVSVTETASPASIATYASEKPPVIRSIPEGVEYVPGEIIVKFISDASSAGVSSHMKDIGAMMKHRIHRLNMEVWVLPAKDEKSMLDIIAVLSADPDVVYAEPNYIYKAAGIPNDPRFDKLWGLHNTGQTGGTVDADIDATEAWDIFTGSSDVVVAVIDTGVDYNHEDLADNMWVNEGEIPGNGVDDDGNGYIDDIYGYDFYYNDSDPMDGRSHGTHVSGTIGAVGNNSIGVVGVNHDVRIMAVKFLSDGGYGSTDGAILSILYAVDNGAQILSNSWGGGGYSSALRDAIVYANNDNDVLFMASAGNSSRDTDVSPHYPSSYDVPNVMSIAATDYNDLKASFSNWGLTTVDIGAPGVSTLSTIPGNRYASYSGTSMATPHVSGVAALVKGYNPALSALDIKALIMESVDPIDALAGRTVTGGRLNAESALMLAGPDWVRVTGILSGEIPAGFSTELTVFLDAMGKIAGDYAADITIMSNDPVNPEITVPASLTVVNVPSTADPI